jgi:outer membrane immunogenic protein
VNSIKVLMAGTAASALLAGPATAADLATDVYVPEQVLSPVPASNWTGLYLGVHGGYAWGNEDGSGGKCDGGGADNFPICGGINLDGWFGGGQVGYNYQGTSNLIGGIEADISFSDISGDWTTGAKGKGDPVHDTIDLSGTLRGKVGYSFGHWYPYLTGGLALAHLDRDSDADGLAGGEVLFGWTVGVGAEVAIHQRWSLKAEYLFTHYMEQGVGDPGISTFGFDVNTVRVGLNYRF